MARAASRILRLLAWLLALVFFITTAALIYESAQSGVSPLFSWASELETETLPAPVVTFTSISGVFEVVTLTHMFLGILASWTVICACLRHGARKSIRTAGWLIPVAATLMAFAIFAPLIQSQLILGTGWTLALGLDQPPLQNAAIVIFLAADPLVQWPLLLVFCYAGAATLLAVTKAERRIALVILGVALVTLALLITGWIMAGRPINQLARTAPLGLGLLAFVSFLQSEADRPGHAHIWVGTAMTIAAGIYSTSQAATGLTNPTETVLMTTMAYTGPYAMAMFLGFAYFDIRWQPRLPRLLVWGHALGLAVVAGLAFVPLASPEMRSFPIRYIDYPAAYEPTRFMLANAQALLLIWALVGLALMGRYRLPQAPHLPPLQAQSTEPASPQAA